ncbi:MAG: cell wall hydrolase [Turicibacter sp.]|nr:cell wall hydrolase [Turicibacter sp.]
MVTDLTHTVQQGDTLSQIAAHYEVSIDSLLEWNHIENQNLIYDGEMLILLPDGLTGGEEENYTYDAPVDVDESAGFTQAELTLLAQLVFNEANVEPYEGKMAVVHVVLNRMASGQFPGTVEDVIHQKNQFSGSAHLASKPVSDENMQAVKDALNSPDITGGALYFWDPSLSSDSYMKTLDVLKVIGGHEFLA